MTASSLRSAIRSTIRNIGVGVVGARDPVDRHHGHVRALPAQRVGHHRQRLAVLLDDDPQAGQVAAAQVGEDVLEALRLRRPQLAQPLPAQGPDALRAAGEDLGRARWRPAGRAACPQRSAAANHAFIPMPVVARNMSTGAGQHLARWRRAARRRRRVGVQRQRRRPLHPGARGARAARPARRPCGPRSRRSGSPRSGPAAVHPTSDLPVVPRARRRRPPARRTPAPTTCASSRHRPVRRSKACLCIGEATNGTSPRVPTMPRASTDAFANGSWLPSA